jgi:hypothetical protein
MSAHAALDINWMPLGIAIQFPNYCYSYNGIDSVDNVWLVRVNVADLDLGSGNQTFLAPRIPYHWSETKFVLNYVCSYLQVFNIIFK